MKTGDRFHLFDAAFFEVEEAKDKAFIGRQPIERLIDQHLPFCCLQRQVQVFRGGTGIIIFYKVYFLRFLSLVAVRLR